MEPVALFCGEDSRFGTHLEVYPRNSGEVYLCGIGGSEHVDADALRAGKYPPGQVQRFPEIPRDSPRFPEIPRDHARKHTPARGLIMSN